MNDAVAHIAASVAEFTLAQAWEAWDPSLKGGGGGTVPIPSLRVIEPLHTVRVDGIAPAAIAPYIELHPTRPVALLPAPEWVVDPLLAAIAYWPWVLTPPVLALLLVTLWGMRRVLSRRQRVGVTYCRRCNYDLSAAAAGVAVCAECGATLGAANVVQGRSILRRGRWLGVPMALLVVALGLGLALACGWRPAGRPCPSVALQRLADRWGVSVPKELKRSCTAFYELDLATGTLTKLYVLPEKGLGYVRIMPDGQTIVSSRSDGTFWRFNADGTGLRRAPIPVRPARPIAATGPIPPLPGTTTVIGGALTPLIGAAPGGGAVFLMREADGDAQSEVWRWRFADDSVERVTNLPSTGPFLGRMVNASEPARQYARLRTPDERFVSLPSLTRKAREPFVVAMHTGGPEPAWSFDAGAEIDAPGALQVRPDGTGLYATADDGRSIVGIDLEKPGVFGKVDVPPLVRAEEIDIDINGRFLAVGGAGQLDHLFLVRDVERREWVAALGRKGSEFQFGMRFGFSGDGRYSITATYSARKRYDELLIWDIGAITGAK